RCRPAISGCAPGPGAARGVCAVRTWKIVAMLPDVVPVLEGDEVRLRPWEPRDAALVTAVTSDPLIPLITSVPPMGSPQDVEAYLDRQHGCVAEGAGFSFAVADISTDEAVGHIGLWIR